MTDTLEIIRRHHEAIVAEERLRRRSEPELRRLLPLLQAQAGQWREAGGREADCPLVPLIEAFERTLRGAVAEGPAISTVEGPSPFNSPTEEKVETVKTADLQAADPAIESEPEMREEPVSGRGRGRRRTEG